MTTSRFLIRPRPLPAESLSSWRQRSGWANGYALFPVQDERRRRLDPDIGASDVELQWLVDSHGLEPEQVSVLALSRFFRDVLKSPIGSKHPRWWLRSRMVRGAKSHGPMVCPICLASDDVPYFRLHWRFGFFTDCEVHRCALLDHCPQCRNSIWPSGWGVAERIATEFNCLRLCWHCGADLSEVCCDDVHQPTGATFHRWISDGQAQLGAHFVPIAEALDAIRGISQLFLRRSSRDAMALANTTGQAIVKHLSAESLSALSIEHLGLQDRCILVPAALEILQAWPASFIQFARENQISRMHFFGTTHMQPSWMNECIDHHLARQNRWVTPDTVRNAIEELTVLKGHKPTKTDVKAVLKWDGGPSLNAFYETRKQATVEEWHIFLEALFQMSKAVRIRGHSLRAFNVDLCILLGALVSNESIPEVINLPHLSLLSLIESSGLQMSLVPGLYPLAQSAIEYVRKQQHDGAKPRQVRKRLGVLMSVFPQELLRDPRVFQMPSGIGYVCTSRYVVA